VNNVSSQYKIIGATKYRENSQKQIDALAKALAESGIKAKVYYGFNFTTPFISDAMEQIKKDGIKRIVMFNQGAQCSWASQGENMKDIREYLHEHPEYDAEVLAYREYSNDKRFRDLLHDVIMRDVKEKFPGKSPAFTCVMVASHGLPTRMTDEGDPAIKQMKSAFEYVAAKAKPYKFYHGFLNDDFIPGATWASPASDEVALKMRSDDCR
jgi:ferrochelatase